MFETFSARSRTKKRLEYCRLWNEDRAFAKVEVENGVLQAITKIGLPPKLVIVSQPMGAVTEPSIVEQLRL
jgi:hypothetical protein